MRVFPLIYISILLFSSISQAGEVTDPTKGQNDNFILEADGKKLCTLRVSSPGYRVRSAPNNGKRCGVTLGSSGMAKVQPLGIEGNWIKFSNPSCPNGVGYTYYKAFNYQDRQVYQNGRCTESPRRGSANPPPTPAADRSTSVKSKGKNTHRFVLDSCKGIRRDKYGNGAYGASRKGGRTHSGCDYTASVGTPLKSPCKGRVSSSKYSGKAGNLVQISCDNGDIFKMLHLKQGSRVKAGTRVGIGSRVGAVGKTGNANVKGMVPHVHLQAIVRGRTVDPASLWSCK